MQLKGVAAAPGLAIGPCLVLEDIIHPDLTQKTIDSQDIQAEQDKVKNALDKAGKQLELIRDRAVADGQEEQSAVMEAHLMMLADPILNDGFLKAIENDLLPAVGAVQIGIEKQAAVFEALEDAYFRERAQDIRDIGRRVVNLLLGIQEPDVSNLPNPLILVARDITPSMMASVDAKNLLGIAAEIGGRTSHTAILANNLAIPAVLGCQGVVQSAHGLDEDEQIAVDGSTGIVHVGITVSQAEKLRQEIRRREEIHHELEQIKDTPTRTMDGVTVQLAANVMGPDDLDRIQAVGAEGVGLYRTEFLFMDRSQAPDEEEQYKAYRKIVEGMAGKPVIIRTMDIGGDKGVEYLNLEQEENPFLGYRALRICLDRPDLFLTQLKAILRAGVHGRVLIMFPMVSSLEELRAAKIFVDQAKEELRTADVPFAEDVPTGIMIEIPSAALIADLLIKEADFFSIGSNDLTQYTIAVDRMNAKIGQLYTSFHPAMLRLIKQVIDPTIEAGGDKFIGMCGEMAGDPKATMLLLGLGLQEFSVGPAGLLRIKKIIQGVTMDEAKLVANHAISMETAGDVEEYLADAIPEDLKKYLL